MKVEKYELYYLTYLIADFYVDENENITYVPFEENIVHINVNDFLFVIWTNTRYLYRTDNILQSKLNGTIR